MKIVGIIQVRTGSHRLPNKVFCMIGDQPLLWHVVNQAKKSSLINQIVIATTNNPNDDIIEQWSIKNNLCVVRGSESDVIKRFIVASEITGADIIVRITADDPFKDPAITDLCIKTFLESTSDIVCNNFPPTFPEGLDVEVFSHIFLKRLDNDTISPSDREHVTIHVYENPELYSIVNVFNNDNVSNIRLTVDTKKDLELADIIYKEMNLYNHDFSFNDIIHFLHQNPRYIEINKDVTRSRLYLSDQL